MGALVEIADVRLADPLHPELHGGFVDEPKAGAVRDTNAVDVLGWALGAGREAVAVELALDGRLLSRERLRAPRPDLAHAFSGHPRAGRAGFRTTLDLTGASAELELQVSVVLKGGTRAPLASIRGRRRWRHDHSPTFARLVSVVVVPDRDGQQRLAETIESALAQTYPHVEVLVADDGSSEGVCEIAARYEGVRCVRADETGAAEARNVGIRASNGDFLVFLDTQERPLPEAVAIGVRALERSPQCPAAIGAGRPSAHSGCSARAIYRRSLFEHVRGFDPAIDGDCVVAFELAVAREFPICRHEAPVAVGARLG
jgi:Glycosyl transferase family 2